MSITELNSWRDDINDTPMFINGYEMFWAGCMFFVVKFTGIFNEKMVVNGGMTRSTDQNCLHHASNDNA